MTIQIESVDENKSKDSANQPQYVASLTGKLDATGINNLAAIMQRSPSADVLSVNISTNPGNVVIFDTLPNTNLETAVAVINGWLAQVSGSEDQFKQKIRDVNTKLKSGKTLVASQ